MSFAAALLVTAGHATAQALPEGFKACAAYRDRDERLGCYDAEVARLSSPAAKEQNFGVANGSLARGKAQQAAPFDEISARITEVTTRPHGEMIVTLDNAQVWSQTRPGGQFRVQPGDAIKVKAGALGAYLLIAPSGRATKVTRIK